MKNKYINLYETTYNKKLREVEKKYKERIFNYKVLGYKADYALELFNQEKPRELEDSVFTRPELKKLVDEFENRNKIYNHDHLYKAFDEFIIPEFEVLDSNPFANFIDFVFKYACYKAWNRIDYIFYLNKSTYKLMYKHNLLENFKIIGYNGGDNSQEFFKYNRLEYPPRINQFEHLEKLNNQKIFNFSQKVESIYNAIFNSEKCYDYLIIKDYLHISTSFDDYKNVFLKDFRENSSFIKFYCTTIKVAVFLRLLEDLNDKMDFEKIGNTKKFKSKGDNFLKGSTLRQQRTQASDELIKEVEFDLKELKKLALKN